MSKAYLSNLSRAEYEFLSDLIPGPKPGGRPRTVDMWEILNAMFYVLVEGCRWRSLPGDFPAWQMVYTYFRNWRKDGTWVKLHDCLREWTRVEADRQPSPSEAILDSQSVKTAAGVSESVGFDSGKVIRKMALTVRLPGAKIAPTGSTSADCQTGLENNGAKATIHGTNSFGSEFIRRNQTTLS